MTTVVLCDGAALDQGAATPERLIELRHAGAKSNVNVNIQSPTHALKSSVDDLSADLMRIAAYTYSADQQVSRGGRKDIYGSRWERDFKIYIPVSGPDLWSRCADALSEALEAVSGDRWQFVFSKAHVESATVSLLMDHTEDLGEPDVVCLLSGGLDSLCAAVEAVEGGRKPLLVGHSPAFHIRNRRRDLVHALRSQYNGGWQFPDVSAAVSRSDGKDPPDTTQRTRSFLYASLGAIFAHRLGIEDVLLADNGIVSLNLPLNAQLVGTLASRSTHPKFIRLFNQLLEMLYDQPPVLKNPLWDKTRPETLEILKSAGVTSLIKFTSSCAHSRLLKAERNHCGTCSQCVDRRFAVAAAGLDDCDPASRYMVDCFTGALPEGDAKTMVLAYHAFALDISRLTGDGLFQKYSQLYDCFPRNHAEQARVAQALVDMLHRHANSVLSVTEQAIVASKAELARRELPGDCLLSLLGTGGSAPRAAAGFKHSENYQFVELNGEVYDLSEAQACVIRFLDEAKDKGRPIRSHNEVIFDLQAHGFGTTKVKNLFPETKRVTKLLHQPARGTYQLAPSL